MCASDAEQSASSAGSRCECSSELRLIDTEQEDDSRHRTDTEDILHDTQTCELADYVKERVNENRPDELCCPVLSQSYVEIVEKDSEKQNLHYSPYPVNCCYWHSISSKVVRIG